MFNNHYVKDMIDRILKNPPKLILPEQEDPRVQKAQNLLLDIGFDILNISAFNDFDSYKEHIKNKKFTDNWTDQMLQEYVQNPLIKSLILLDMGYSLFFITITLQNILWNITANISPKRRYFFNKR